MILYLTVLIVLFECQIRNGSKFSRFRQTTESEEGKQASKEAVCAWLKVIRSIATAQNTNTNTNTNTNPMRLNRRCYCRFASSGTGLASFR